MHIDAGIGEASSSPGTLGEAAKADIEARLGAAVRPDRLLETALLLCGIPSPTRSADRVADALAALLESEGFAVERPAAGWPESPAVVARLDSGRPGPTMQFTGHLDTVHLPFVAPFVEEGVLRGSGVADMKGGLASCVEAMRALRDADALPAGKILLTAYDHHEAPWGDCRQLLALLEAGVHGDAALVPEYLADRLPVAGRGLAIFQARIHRDGVPVHEVFRPAGQPNVLLAGCELVRRLAELNTRLGFESHPITGPASTFVGKIVSGEIFNQSHTECRVEGTRRWLPGQNPDMIRDAFLTLVQELAADTRTTIDVEYQLVGRAFSLDTDHLLVRAFESAYQHVSRREPLAEGPKPFLDDGNHISARAGIPVITHGPNATGAHTTDERVPVSELYRVAATYALTARRFCGGAVEPN